MAPNLINFIVRGTWETQETWVRSLGQEDLLEQEMATHSSILAWRIAWTEKPGGIRSLGWSQRVRHDLATEHTHTVRGKKYIDRMTLKRDLVLVFQIIDEK